MTPPSPLALSLQELRDSTAALEFGIETAGVEAERRTARAVVQQIDDYLLPRLLSLDAPLLAAVGGSTGAGKSTLVNSIAGSDVSHAGVLRPTTRVPVLLCAEADHEWFIGDRVLPGLARVIGADAGPHALRVVTVPGLPAGLALIDTPDIDSVVESNRELAEQLLAASDLWVFVTTAARYADAVPWELLADAQRRKTALAIVLNRVPPDAATAVERDLRGMLGRAGLQDVMLFVIEEGQLPAGRLPDDQVSAVRGWLRGLADDADARRAVVHQTLSGALDSLDERVSSLAHAVDRQSEAARDLRAAAEAAYAGALVEVDEGVRSGTLLRGEVLARWHDFVGASEWMRSLQSTMGRLRDRLTAALTGRSAPMDELHEALESSVETLLRTAAERAAERTFVAWRGIEGGAALLRGRERTLDRVSAGFAAQARSEVRDWQGYVLDLVRTEGAGRRTTARFVSLGVNGAGLAVMIAVFAHTGGLTGGEVAVAGGSAAVAQKLLEAVFGDAAIRALAARARHELEQRAGRLLTDERARFEALIEAAAPAPGEAARLRDARSAMANARRRESIA